LAPIAPAATDFEGDVADNAINQVLEMAAPYLVGQRFDKKKNNMLTFKRTTSTYCKLCKRNHNSDNTVFITVHETVVFLHCRRSEDRIFIGKLGRAANEPDADGFDDEPDADGFDNEPEEGQPEEGQQDAGQPDDELNQPPIDHPAAVVPPDRDFTCCLDYKRWAL